tara:strand:+ start:168 stop:422 length:255 start_codon:yes stop_codon:yes gene_type:complete
MRKAAEEAEKKHYALASANESALREHEVQADARLKSLENEHETQMQQLQVSFSRSLRRYFSYYWHLLSCGVVHWTALLSFYHIP